MRKIIKRINTKEKKRETIKYTMNKSYKQSYDNKSLSDKNQVHVPLWIKKKTDFFVNYYGNKLGDVYCI